MGGDIVNVIAAKLFRHCHLVSLLVRKNDFRNDPGATLAGCSTLLQPPAAMGPNLANGKGFCYRFLHLYYSSSQPAPLRERNLPGPGPVMFRMVISCKSLRIPK
jgi:hypothetical protein